MFSSYSNFHSTKRKMVMPQRKIMNNYNMKGFLRKSLTIARETKKDIYLFHTVATRLKTVKVHFRPTSAINSDLTSLITSQKAQFFINRIQNLLIVDGYLPKKKGVKGKRTSINRKIKTNISMYSDLSHFKFELNEQ